MLFGIKVQHRMEMEPYCIFVKEAEDSNEFLSGSRVTEELNYYGPDGDYLTLHAVVYELYWIYICTYSAVVVEVGDVLWICSG